MALAFRYFLAGTLGLAALGAQAQVFKCNVGGKMLYQQAPCDMHGMTGGRLDIPSPTSPTPSSPSNTSPLPRPDEARPAAPPVAQPAAPVYTKPQLEAEADACFAWYQPLLRDPAGAYYRNPSKDGRVVSILVYATNGFGGYVSRTASCEFNSGRHDIDWTKIHAQRLGW